MKAQEIDLNLSSILVHSYNANKPIRIKWAIHHSYAMLYYDICKLKGHPSTNYTTPEPDYGYL